MENEFLMSLLPTWQSLSPSMDVDAADVPCPAAGDHHSAASFFNLYHDKPMDGSFGGPFPLLSSMAPSPADDGYLIGELIGKLGGFSSHGLNSVHPRQNALKLGHYGLPPNPGFSADYDYSPASMFPSISSRSFNGFPSQFAELAAMGQMMSRVSSSPSLNPISSPTWDPNGTNKPNMSLQDQAELSNSQEDSSVSDPVKNPGLETAANAPGQTNRRKRKAAAVSKGNEAEPEVEVDGAAKRPKQSGGSDPNENGPVKTEEGAGGHDGDSSNVKEENPQGKNEVKTPEPPKDYIHVRARRGQATDSHSLAERVRREKISERMKMLQDLVPGCNKVTGKALMLDEIINYVQSLQRQVEFLSMKLATVNTADTNSSNAMAKDVFHSDITVPNQMLPLDSSQSGLYGQKNPAVHLPNGITQQYSADPVDVPFLPYPATFRGEDLHSIVQMGFGQN